MISKKHYPLLFIVLSSFVFMLLFPEISLADKIYYTTECGEQIEIGDYTTTTCDAIGTTCSDCTCKDQESDEWEEYYATSSASGGYEIYIRACGAEHNGANCGMGSCNDEACEVKCSIWERVETCDPGEPISTTATCGDVTKVSKISPVCGTAPPSPPSRQGDYSYCAPVATGARYYTTGCDESIKIGTCRWLCCRICCSRRGGCWCCGWCIRCSHGGSWYEYQASTTACRTEIFRRSCSTYKTGNCRYGSCQDEQCCVYCQPWEICEECGSWQKTKDRNCSVVSGKDYDGGSLTSIKTTCNVLTNGLCKPQCQCDKDCIDKPLSQDYFRARYYNNSIYPPNPWIVSIKHDMYPPTDIFLPVKLDWDDVRGWKDGWQTLSEKKVVEKCSVGTVGTERCIADYSTNLSDCKNGCRETCYEQIRDKDPPKENLYQYRQEHYSCLNTCETTCETTHATSTTGCTATCPSPDKCYPESEYIKSYKIKIWDEPTGKYIHHYGVTSTAYSEVLANSEFIPPDSCFFNSISTYYWTVQACCNAYGTECGSESATSTFTTNSAPEPIYPLDADWNGTGTVKNIPTVPATSTQLRWCQVPEIQGSETLSYDFLPFLLDASNTPYCHPYRQAGASCIPLNLIVFNYPAISTSSKADYAYHYHKFLDDRLPNFFTKITDYLWKISACNLLGWGCDKWSQGWRFQTTLTTLEKITGLHPPNNTIVPLPVQLKWHHIHGANSYFYEFWPEGSPTSTTTTSTVPEFRTELFLGKPPLEVNQEYSWRVKPCWDFEGKRCEDWSATSSFITTLAPPTLKTPSDSTTSSLPINFDWDDVSYADYYHFQISSTSSATSFEAELITSKTPRQSRVTVDYPEIRPLSTYFWRVRTCADIGFCGEWSSIRKFGVEKIGTPSNPNPSDKGTLYSYLPHQPLYKPTLSFSSVQGAKYYQISLGYGLENTCPDYATGTTILTEIVSSPSLPLNLKCEGKYYWTVRACLDPGCSDKDVTSDWTGLCSSYQPTAKTWNGNFWESLIGQIIQVGEEYQLCNATSTSKDDLIDNFFWSFYYSKPTPPPKVTGGFVPCNRGYDDPKTPWNDTEPCQFHHLFYLLINVLDFVLWKLGLLLLVLLLIATGVILYLAPWILPEQPQPLINVKSLWRAAGIGYLIIFFAWAIINLILILIGYQFGYQFQFFGHWWQFKF